MRNLDLLLKFLAIPAAIVSAVIAMSQYIEVREREFKKPFNEQQMQTVAELIESIQAVADAKPGEDQQKASRHFWMLYQGKARIYLTKSLYKSLAEMPANYVATCIDERYTSQYFTNCNSDTASISIIGFASTAQNELALDWRKPLIAASEQPQNPMRP